MELMCEHSGGVTVVILTGTQLDASTAAEFKRAIEPVLAQHWQIIFDLGHLGFVDSCGLGAFLSCLRQVQAKGGDLKLYGLAKRVRALIELVRMHKVLEIFDSREEAIRAFQL